MVKRATSKISSLKKYILLVILCYGLVELLSFAALLGLNWIKGAEFKPYSASLLFRRVKGQVEKFLENRYTYIQHHPTLGWSIQPNGREGIYKANALGLRGDEDYLQTPSPGVLRIATFGDSFTHGDEVANNETWQFFLASQMSRAEVMNFGVPAFGPDQAFLRFQEEGRNTGAHLVFIGFMSENIRRTVNVFRPFIMPLFTFPLTKPRYTLKDGKLSLIPNPMPTIDHFRDMLDNPSQVLHRLGENDFYYQLKYHESSFDILPSVRLTKLLNYAICKLRAETPFQGNGMYNQDSEAFSLTKALLDAFYEEAIQVNALPVVLIFPMRRDLDYPPGSDSFSYVPLLEWLRVAGLRYLDFHEVLYGYGKTHDFDDLFTGQWSHYSPLANKIVANRIHDFLVSQKLTTPADVMQQIRAPEDIKKK